MKKQNKYQEFQATNWTKTFFKLLQTPTALKIQQATAALPPILPSPPFRSSSNAVFLKHDPTQIRSPHSTTPHSTSLPSIHDPMGVHAANTLAPIPNGTKGAPFGRDAGGAPTEFPGHSARHHHHGHGHSHSHHGQHHSRHSHGHGHSHHGRGHSHAHNGPHHHRAEPYPSGPPVGRPEYEQSEHSAHNGQHPHPPHPSQRPRNPGQFDHGRHFESAPFREGLGSSGGSNSTGYPFMNSQPVPESPPSFYGQPYYSQYGPPTSYPPQPLGDPATRRRRSPAVPPNYSPSQISPSSPS
jgi:hypothetical protein